MLANASSKFPRDNQKVLFIFLESGIGKQMISGTKFLNGLKGPCATLVLCERTVLSEHANKPYMNCKQHENIEKAMAANYYASSVQRDLEDHLFISG